ncbi:GSCFA domain-containing protein [Pseudogemmobacter bohemicus]|uniref:GSCFA domain-containing protein n=1 Tax=Pseudogemmobacter bohemicus TaxID=2250708 RepID=UPI00130091AD|nr:GSCFA domain-containing protein [Pseudogemmobacter bohemicus]
MRIHVIGNCQAAVVTEQIRMLLPAAEVSSDMILSKVDAPEECDVVFIQKPHEAQFRSSASIGPKLVTWPAITFGGFHPDIVTLKGIQSPTGGWHSAIALQAYRLGISEEDALSLYRPEVFEHLNFHRIYDLGMSHLRHGLEEVDFPADRILHRWSNAGCFMHGVNHPRRVAMEDVSLEMVRKLGLSPDDYALRNFGIDRLALSACWSVYPWISEQRGLGKGQFLFRNATNATKNPARIYSLQEFVAESYQIYREADPELLQNDRLKHARFEALSDLVLRKPVRNAAPENPYRGLPGHQFWKHGVTRPAKSEVDPVVAPKFPIRAGDLVATAGSCFAQHIARTLVASGFNYYVAETAPGNMAKDEAEARQFGLFSARFGNLYTTRQLVQLFDRAFGHFTPEDKAWEAGPGRLVDPFRPTVEPDGFESLATLEADRNAHFASVRDMFTRLDTFIFTLGLTEGWRAKSDGAVFPLAPGVSGGQMAPERYEFVNFTVEEVKEDLEEIWKRIRSINPVAKMILTISPVPLIATYEPRHVLVSTVASKSILRAAVEDITRRESDVAYFPSFEIITGQHAGNTYFEDDLRSVRPEGVAHVMSLFLKHYAGISTTSASASTTPEEEEEFAREAEKSAAVVCDEERIAF